MTNSIDIRKENDLATALGKADVILNKKYLSILDSAKIENQYPAIIDNVEINNINNRCRFFDITKIVLNKNENMRDKLATLFNAIGTAGASVLMLIKGTKEKASIFYGVRVDDLEKISVPQSILEKNFKANFLGSELEKCNDKRLEKDILSSIYSDGFVSSVSDIAGLRFDNETKERVFMQGIEKLVDVAKEKEYSLLIIADPIALAALNESRRSLEDLYSSLIPFSGSQMTFGVNETESVSSSLSHGTTKTISHSIANSVSHTTGTSNSVSIGAHTGISFGVAVGGFTAYTRGKSQSDTEGSTETDGTADSDSLTINSGEQSSKGKNQSLQISFENHTIKQLLKKIDKTLERYDNCSDLGMWKCAAYCISKDKNISSLVASTYRALIRGKNSSLENGTITNWNKNQSSLIIRALKHFEHPILTVQDTQITPGTLISSAELAIQAGLPNHSVPGIPVIECAEFGRTVSSYNYKIPDRIFTLGKIYNMHEEEKLSVKLNINNLASHTFVTGSTGSGKSNTIYQVLSQLRERAVNFLVVEPAKGEYKNLFGNYEDVAVYGTNPDLTPLLRINPFSFPGEIHILEHLDRLIEIFNVCWPMYAAMPAVLKEAVEKSYEDCGWNLTKSTNEYDSNYYPTFTDVTRNIRTIIDSSEYDAENKGAYKGSLITRLKSLTNGINGLIFTTDELSNSELFDENVIVDLSRVGSTETKSLIMGLLVLKLQEYRMTSREMNDSLRHVTVLEEAHNLLKRTSTEQSQDSGNLLGKSVEMLTNAIAEMRTYGEGFIIADQAPALLDMAVIRNTNTKIIMRLPDQDDRELVGKAASLNDDQITELSKLPCGVAAVYQNDWIEPVLCKVARYKYDGKPYQYKKTVEKSCKDYDTCLTIAEMLCKGTAIKTDAEEKELKDKMNELNLKDSSKVWILKSVKAPLESPRYTKLAPVISELFPELREEFITSFNRSSDPMQWTDDVDAAIRKYIQLDIEESLYRSIRQCIITDYLFNELHKADLLERWSVTGGVK